MRSVERTREMTGNPENTTQNVRLRSANRDNACNTWNVNSSGNVNNNNAVNALRCAPDCVVLRTYKLSHRDGVRPI